ncbi:MAG: hypothetical protein WCP91_03050 [Candidatus Berkelbacteria bacterium]
MSSFWKVFISIIVTAAVAGSGTWYATNYFAKKTITSKDTQIASLNKTLDKYIAQSEAAKKSSSSDSTTQQATPQSPAPNPWLYTNAKYGFTLTFNSKWTNYSVVETAPSSDPHATAYLYVCAPTTDASWQDKKAGYYCPFSISVATLANKAAYEADNAEAETPTYIKSNANYAFYYSQAQAMPTDGQTFWDDWKTVKATFATL